jgi:hypothetical protein
MSQPDKNKAQSNTKPATPKAETDKGPEKAYVRTPQGELLHLYTGARFTINPLKVELDSFVQSQLDAGKLILSDE